MTKAGKSSGLDIRCSSSSATWWQIAWLYCLGQQHRSWPLVQRASQEHLHQLKWLCTDHR
jgi:hypothetical protein